MRMYNLKSRRKCHFLNQSSNRQEVQKIYKWHTATPILSQPNPPPKEKQTEHGFGGDSRRCAHGHGRGPRVQCSCVQGWGLRRLDHHRQCRLQAVGCS